MQYSTAFTDAFLALVCAACVWCIGRARRHYGESDQPALFCALLGFLVPAAAAAVGVVRYGFDPSWQAAHLWLSQASSFLALPLLGAAVAVPTLLLTALVANGLTVAEYTALQLKKAVTGHGKAHKDQVQEMVRRLLQLPGLPGKDAADALGLCITHAQVARTTAAINQVSPLQARTHAAYKAGRSY
jgi:hypothetical protein